MRIVSMHIERFGALEDVKLTMKGGDALPSVPTSPVHADPAPSATETKPTKAGRTKRTTTSARKSTAKSRAASSSATTAPTTSPASTPSLFPDAGSGLTVIHGPNEAGKTTLLRAIRYLLLGDDRVSGDKRASSFALGEASVRAIVELHRGTRIEIHRRKSKPSFVGRVLGTGDDAPEDWFLGVLGHPDPSLFRNVFAFSIDELARGSKELEKDKGQLQNLLFGSGLGGTIQPSNILKALELEQARLFKDRGQNQVIPARLKKIEELKFHLRDATTSSEFLEQLDERIGAETRAVEAAKTELAALAAESDRLSALISALEPFEDWRRARSELEALGDVADLPPGARLELERARTTRRTAEAELEHAAAARPALERDLAACQPMPEWLDVGPDIESLDRALGAYLEAEREARAHVGDHDALLRKIERHLEGLAPSLALSRLRDLSVPRELRVRLVSATDDIERQRDEAREAAAVARESRTQRELLAREQSEAGAPPFTADHVAALRAFVAESNEALASRTTLETLESDVRRLERAEKVLRTKLDPAPSGHDPSLVPMPRPEEIDAFDRRLTEHEETLRRIEQDLARVDRELSDVRLEIATIRADGKVPTEGDLAAARDRRQEGWALVKRALEGHLEVQAEIDFDPELAIPEAFEHAMHDADEIVDLMRFRADAVQRRAQKEAAATHYEAELGRLVEARNAAIDEESSARRAWVELWIPAGVVPRGPSVMRAWLADRDRWLIAVEQLESAMERHDVLHARLESFVRQGRLMLGMDGDLARLRAEAERRLGACADYETKRQRLEAAIARADETIAREGARARELEQSLERAQATYEKVWSEIGIGTSIAPQAAIGLVDELLRLRDSWLEAEAEQSERSTRLEANIAAFEGRLDTVLKRLSLTRSAAAVDAEVESLRDRLARARDVARKANDLRERLARLDEDTTRHKVALSRAGETLDALMERAGASDDAGLERAIERFEAATKLQHAIVEAERAMARVRGPWSLEALKEAAAWASEDSLAADLRGLEAKRASATEDHDRHLRDMMRLQGDRDRLDGSARAAELMADIASERAALRADVEAFAVTALAKAVLERNIAEFERRNQPELITAASELFASMTGGRYRGVHVTGKQELFVERASGERRSPDELSTGTTEQLFFALRLAYVGLYGAKSEPLPVVLDDVLVNFDRDRSAATLAALGTFAARTQVLFFTCHPHLVALARETLPGAAVLSIQPNR